MSSTTPAPEQNRGDADPPRDGDAALSEFIPNLDPDDWDEDALEVFRRIVEGVNRLRGGPASRNAGTSRPFSLNLDWDYWDADVAGLLAQVEHAIEQLRAAMEDGEPLPSTDFVFRFDESIIDDDLVVFVRRIQVVLNGLREGQSPRAIDSQLMLFDSSETQTQDGKSSTPPSKSAEVPSRKDESSWQSLVVAARDSGQHGKAVELAEQAVREYPRSDWLWRILGGELTELDLLDEAENALDTAHRLNPKAEWLWRHFAALHRKRKDLEGEIESLETLYSLGVATWYDLNQLGIAYHNYRDLAKALKYYRLSAAAEPQAAPWVNLALVYRDPELSQDADAADACRRALALKPDYERAKELLDTTKRKLVPLAARAQSAATGLVKPFDFYISPFEMFQIEDVTVAEGLDAKAIKKVTDLLKAEIHLNDGKVGWLGDYSLDKSRALAVVDELDDEAKRRYHVAIFRNKPLLNFLTRGDIRHFLYSDGYFPCDTEELLHREPGFRTFLSKPFARQYNRVLTGAIKHPPRLPVVEVLFDGRRWVEPHDEDVCFEGANNRIAHLVERMREKAEEGQRRKIEIGELKEFFRQESLPELLNLLPTNFAWAQRDFVRVLRDLAIDCYNEHDDSGLSKSVLGLCKQFTTRNVDLSKDLDDDFQTIELRIEESKVVKLVDQSVETAKKGRPDEARLMLSQALATCKDPDLKQQISELIRQVDKAQQLAKIRRNLHEPGPRSHAASGTWPTIAKLLKPDESNELRVFCVLAFILLVGVGLLIALIKSAGNSKSSDSPSQSSSPVQPYSTPQYSPPSRTDGGLSSRIDAGKARARILELELDQMDAELESLSAKIKRSGREVDSYAEQVRRGVRVNKSTYQRAVDSHNRLVNEYNTLLGGRSQKHSEYERNIKSVNEMVARYNRGER